MREKKRNLLLKYKHKKWNGQGKRRGGEMKRNAPLSLFFLVSSFYLFVFKLIFHSITNGEIDKLGDASDI